MRKTLSYIAEFILHTFGDKGLLIFTSLFVGVFASLFAVALSTAVHQVFHYISPIISGEWYGFLIPGIGAALSIFFLRHVVKDFLGHGIPDVLFSITRKGGILRIWDMFSRMISSFLTVSFGGSAGLEGPIVFTGSAIGSNISTYFHLPEKHRIILVGAGAAAGIGAIFNAPLTGMVFALEILLSEWTPRTIIPVGIATIVSTSLSRLLLGNTIAFSSLFTSMESLDLLFVVLLGVITGIVAMLFSKGLEFGEKFFKKVFFKNEILSALFGGIIVGLFFLISPKSLGEGHNVVNQIINGEIHPGISAILLLLVMKYLSSISTLSSGGSGGIFAPSLFLGAATGLTFGRILKELFPSTLISAPETYALIGMSGAVAGILQAPITGIFLILEITSGYELTLPLMLVSIISMMTSNIFEKGSIYTKHLIKNNDLLRTGSDGRILAEIDHDDILETNCEVVEDDLTLRGFIEVIKQSKRNQFIVTDRKNKEYLGIIFLHEIRETVFEISLYDMLTVTDLMNPDIDIIYRNESLEKTMTRFENSSSFTLPVIDPETKQYLGLISKASLFTKYRQELLVQTIDNL